ncbi:MAG: helix-turn-helix transcriptional regulator [Massilibacteroides sp.]|nr:helix-turn-helix transcriptional regulator [Massilibacteroides sp.]
MNEKTRDLYTYNLEQGYHRFFFTYAEPQNSIELVSKNHLFVFLTKGSVRINIESYEPTEVRAPSFFLIPKGMYYERITLDPSEIGVLPFNRQIDLTYTPKDNSTKKEKITVGSNTLKTICILKIEFVLLKFIDLIKEVCSYESLGEDYFQLKTKELMYLMEKVYTLQERQNFFCPIFNNEYTFSDFVYNNYKKVRTVKELADLSCYSLSGFEKKFRKVFGIAPSKWLKKKLSMAIYNEIVRTNKPLKEISLDYGFSSPSHFNNFCKTTLFGTPGKLRRRIVIPDNSLISDE